MENETTDTLGVNLQVSSNTIYIKISSCENVRTTYPVADLTMKIEYLNEVLGVSQKVHVEKKEHVVIDFDINIPCDFSSSDDLDKYISNSITITAIETPVKVDMEGVEILSATEVKDMEPKISAESTSGKKIKKSSKNNMKEQSSKGSKSSKDSKTKQKSKNKKTNGYLNDNNSTSEPQDLRILGIAQLDLLPIFLGKTDFTESLPLQQVLICFDDRAIAIKNLPRVQVSVRAEGDLLDSKTTSVLSVSLESIYNIPNLMGPDYRYQICMMMPNSNSTFEPVLFRDGIHKTEKNIDNCKFWPSESVNDLACHTKYMINEDLSDVKNKIGADLKQAVFSEKPRIEWNVLRRFFLTFEKREYFYKQVKKFRKLFFEIYVTPLEEPEQSEREIKSNASSKGDKKKEKESKGKSSSATPKSKKDDLLQKGANEKYLHLMGFADVGDLLYPGVTTCRVACSLNTYHQIEAMELAGQSDSYFRPTTAPTEQEKVHVEPLKKDKGKGKDKKEKKESKTSKNSKQSSDKTKKEPREIVSIDLAQIRVCYGSEEGVVTLS